MRSLLRATVMVATIFMFGERQGRAAVLYVPFLEGATELAPNDVLSIDPDVTGSIHVGGTNPPEVGGMNDLADFRFKADTSPPALSKCSLAAALSGTASMIVSALALIDC